jgi:hypothetical protein
MPVKRHVSCEVINGLHSALSAFPSKKSARRALVLDDLRFVKQIGSGQFSQVYLIYDGSKNFVAKVIDKSQIFRSNLV